MHSPRAELVAGGVVQALRKISGWLSRVQDEHGFTMCGYGMPPWEKQALAAMMIHDALHGDEIGELGCSDSVMWSEEAYFAKGRHTVPLGRHPVEGTKVHLSEQNQTQGL